MRRAFAFSTFVVVTSILLACSARAQNAETPASHRDAQNWLKKIQSAAQKLSFAGTFVYQQGVQIRTSRITHALAGKNEIERLEILDGKPREYVRNNDEIVCYIPDAKTLVIEKRVAHDAFPAILSSSPSDLFEHYTVRNGEVGRVAGRDAHMIVLEPKDNLRYGYRLWADKATGLLLRAQTVNEKGEVVEQITFTQIVIGGVDKNSVKSSFRDTNGWRVENAVSSQRVASGWNVKSVPPGFKKIREVKRTMSDTINSAPIVGALSNTSPHPREVSQIVFSDGLAAISVFIEHGTPNRTEGSMQQGAMNIVGKRQGEFWLTIVGEVPYAAIKQVANSIEFKSK